jgi:hypothetical protein
MLSGWQRLQQSSAESRASQRGHGRDSLDVDVAAQWEWLVQPGHWALDLLGEGAVVVRGLEVGILGQRQCHGGASR